MKRKIHSVTHITVQDFYQKYADKLELTIHDNNHEYSYDMERKINEPSTHRPGLAITGYLVNFAFERIQLFGNSELSYLTSLDPETLQSRIQEICETGIPCIVITQGSILPDEIAAIIAPFRIPIFCTTKKTMHFSNRAALCLEMEFAQTTSAHGCMIHYKGVGVLIKGMSGSGKSETAIGLVERGAALIADDHVIIRNVGGELTAFTKDFTRGFIEMRGIGIINVTNIYGLGSVLPDSKVDLIVNLCPQSDLNKVDRTGIDRKTENILGVEVPYVEIPVAPGRDTVRMVVVTILELQLRRLGYDMANEFNNKLNEKIKRDNDAIISDKES
jgi:HPr kinase/phosphorylase